MYPDVFLPKLFAVLCLSEEKPSNFRCEAGPHMRSLSLHVFTRPVQRRGQDVVVGHSCDPLRILLYMVDSYTKDNKGNPQELDGFC